MFHSLFENLDDGADISMRMTKCLPWRNRTYSIHFYLWIHRNDPQTCPSRAEQSLADLIQYGYLRYKHSI